MLEACAVTCPYCWAGFETTVDCSAGGQDYIEDCPVCCRPHLLRVSIDPDGAVRLSAERE